MNHLVAEAGQAFVVQQIMLQYRPRPSTNLSRHAYTVAMTDEASRLNRQTRSQWKTLDESPTKRRGLGQSTIFSVVRQTPVGPFSPIIAAVVMVLSIGATLVVGWLVRDSIRDGIGDSLQTVLAANTKSLDLWLSQQVDAAELLAADDQVRDIALAALGDLDRTRADPISLAQVAEKTRRVDEAGYVAWCVLDRTGKILIASDDRLKMRRLSRESEWSRRLSAGRSFVTRPIAISSSDLTRPDPSSEVGSTLMFAMVPVKNQLSTLGVIALAIDPARQFSEILSVARIGESGETYAFDRDAVMISRSRFENQLITAGMLAEGQSSPLNIHIKDPGVDIRNRQSIQATPTNWPLTRMADDATRGGQGIDVVGYNDYRGVTVVGAWHWLPEHDFGVATELDADEAFRPLRILRNSFLALIAAVTLAGASLLFLAWITRPKESKTDRVEELKRRLGQYDLQQRIGRGGMGTVYLGAHGLLERKVAIKVLENAEATERSLARFQREVQLTAHLQHPNTIQIYDFGRTDEGTFFYVMEFVDGVSLEQLVDYYGRQPPERVIYLLLQICGSISEAHLAGMVHRDIKPANVLLTSRSGIHDLIKVLDFGLAKQIDHDSLQLTRVDSLTGTPLYMSPESIRDAAAADVLSDIYSIGAVGYTLLCGMPPFDGETSADVCAKKLHQEPMRCDERLGVDLSDDLQRLLLKCLRLDPDQRPQSVQKLASGLLACVDSPHWSQQDAALWWREIFDGPYLDDFEFDQESGSAHGTRGDTAVNEKRPVANPLAQSTVN